MKILEINTGGSPASEQLFPKGAEIVTVKYDEFTEEYVKSIAEGTFDVVFAGHVLQLIERNRVADYVKQMHRIVKHLGEVWIITPSLDWVGEQIAAGNPSPIVQWMLYGEAIPHLSGYTLMWLRSLVEIAPFMIRRATRDSYYVLPIGDKGIKVPQNLVIGARNDLVFDPATALD